MYCRLLNSIVDTLPVRTLQNNLSKQVFADLAKHFENKLFKWDDSSYVVVPRNIKLAESPSFGKPIMLYDAKSSGTKAYINLAKSILRQG